MRRKTVLGEAFMTSAALFVLVAANLKAPFNSDKLPFMQELIADFGQTSPSDHGNEIGLVVLA